MGYGRGAIRRLGLWVVVFGIHGALWVLFTVDRTEERGEAEPELQSPMTVVFLDRPLPDVTPEEEPTPDRQRAERTAKARVSRSGAPEARASTSVDTASDVPAGALDVPNDVDWQHEREVSAQAMLPELMKQNQSKCEAERRPGSLLPKCRKPAKDPQWEPEPRVFGMEGLLPFVRLGKRCVVGLGFFGCAIGKLPPPNSHLFDEMRDGDRPRSSVPEVDTPNVFDP